MKRELEVTWWPTRAAARQAVFEYIEVFYNRRRRHSAIGYRAPHDVINRYRQRNRWRHENHVSDEAGEPQ